MKKSILPLVLMIVSFNVTAQKEIDTKYIVAVNYLLHSDFINKNIHHFLGRKRPIKKREQKAFVNFFSVSNEVSFFSPNRIRKYLDKDSFEVYNIPAAIHDNLELYMEESKVKFPMVLSGLEDLSPAKSKPFMLYFSEPIGNILISRMLLLKNDKDRSFKANYSINTVLEVYFFFNDFDILQHVRFTVISN